MLNNKQKLTVAIPIKNFGRIIIEKIYSFPQSKSYEEKPTKTKFNPKSQKTIKQNKIANAELREIQEEIRYPISNRCFGCCDYCDSERCLGLTEEEIKYYNGYNSNMKIYSRVLPEKGRKIHKSNSDYNKRKTRYRSA